MTADIGAPDRSDDPRSFIVSKAFENDNRENAGVPLHQMSTPVGYARTMRIIAFMVACLGSVAAASAADGAQPEHPLPVPVGRTASDRACPPPTSSTTVVLPDGTRVQASSADCIEPRRPKD